MNNFAFEVVGPWFILWKSRQFLLESESSRGVFQRPEPLPCCSAPPPPCAGPVCVPVGGTQCRERPKPETHWEHHSCSRPFVCQPQRTWMQSPYRFQNFFSSKEMYLAFSVCVCLYVYVCIYAYMFVYVCVFMCVCVSKGRGARVLH